MGSTTGLGSKYIDGYYFDDAWSDTNTSGGGASSCNHSPIGGATEENPWCVVDMGLTQAETKEITTELGVTMRQVNEAILANGGFSTRMMPAYAVHAVDDPATDPRPPARCNAFMRTYCRAESPNLKQAFVYEWTRKSFHDISPIPAVQQDLARFLLVRGRCLLRTTCICAMDTLHAYSFLHNFQCAFVHSHRVYSSVSHFKLNN